MTKLKEMQEEVGCEKFKDGLQPDGSILVGHERQLERLAHRLSQEKDEGVIREELEWLKSNNPPKGLGMGDWWFDKMKDDLK